MKTFTSVAVILLSAQTFAQGAILSPAQLSEDVRGRLATQMEAARQTNAEAFEGLARVRENLARLDEQKRGRMAAVSPLLRGLGAGALYPLIREIAFAATPRGELPRSAWQAWRLALLEVLGEQRSAEATPLFVAVLSSADTDFELNRAAASALGAIGDDAAARALVTLTSGPKRDAVLAGMGNCRRLVVAQTLAQAVSVSSDAQSLAQLSKSLGMVGNSWAWKTPGVTAKEEEAAIRATAARGLMQAFVKSEVHARQEASNALMVVDASETTTLIQQAKRIATGATLTALTGLEQRFAKNPARL